MTREARDCSNSEPTREKTRSDLFSSGRGGEDVLVVLVLSFVDVGSSKSPGSILTSCKTSRPPTTTKRLSGEIDRDCSGYFVVSLTFIIHHKVSSK